MGFRRKKKKYRKPEVQQQSMLGMIIDMSMQEFEDELIKQKVNIGTMNNLILNLESAYNELRIRKDAILDASLRGTVEKAKAQDTINGIYAEMIKIEEKITYLKKRFKELVDVDKTLN